MGFTRTLRAVGSVSLTGALLFLTVPVASADQIREGQWALEAFNGEAVWNRSTGKGVTVAVIDDGVKGNHPDLQGNVLAGKNFVGEGRGDQETVNDHGTAMASIIAGHGHGPNGSSGVKGLAPDAKILPITYLKSNKFAPVGSFAQPLRYAVDEGATVVSMSFAGASLRDDEKQAVAYAFNNDVLLVAGTGNSGSGELSYPAATPGVLAVGAIGKDLKLWENSNYGKHVALTAPGEGIYSAGVTKSYMQSAGTSDATAYVSALAALLRSKFPDLSAGQIANRMTQSAIEPNDPNFTKTPDLHYGYGIINPNGALTRDIPAGLKNGPLKAPEGVAETAGPEGSPPDFSAQDKATKDRETLGYIVVGVIALGLIALVIVVIVFVSKRKNRRNGPPPGGPGGGGYGTPPYGGGMPPQPHPYQQQGPPQPPAHAPGHWPNQQ